MVWVMMVWYRMTNVVGNLPRRFNHFVNSKLEAVDISTRLKAVLRCWIRTANSVSTGNVFLNLSMCSSFVSSGRPIDFGNVSCL